MTAFLKGGWYFYDTGKYMLPTEPAQDSGDGLEDDQIRVLPAAGYMRVLTGTAVLDNIEYNTTLRLRLVPAAGYTVKNGSESIDLKFINID